MDTTGILGIAAVVFGALLALLLKLLGKKKDRPAPDPDLLPAVKPPLIKGVHVSPPNGTESHANIFLIPHELMGDPDIQNDSPPYALWSADAEPTDPHPMTPGLGYGNILLSADLWPKSLPTSGNLWTDDVLSAPDWTQIGYDVMLHELGGHDAQHWDHFTGPGALNTLMNGNLRAAPSNTPYFDPANPPGPGVPGGDGQNKAEDRQPLQDAILRTFAFFRVQNLPSRAAYKQLIH